MADANPCIGQRYIVPARSHTAGIAIIDRPIAVAQGHNGMAAIAAKVDQHTLRVTRERFSDCGPPIRRRIFDIGSAIRKTVVIWLTS